MTDSPTKKTKQFQTAGFDLIKKTLGHFEVDTIFCMADGKEMKGNAKAKRELMLDGKFVRETYNQDMDGFTFKGEMILGYSEKGDVFVGNWCDNSSNLTYPMKGKRIDENSFDLLSMEPFPDQGKQDGTMKTSRHLYVIQPDGSFTFKCWDTIVGETKERLSMDMSYKLTSPCESNSEQTSTMKLTETPVDAVWPEMHYIYHEKIGPFKETASEAWKHLFANVGEITKQGNEITKYLCLFKLKDDILRAGVEVKSKPTKPLPEGFQYVHFHGGKYAKFVLTGAYSNLPNAWRKVVAISESTLKPNNNQFYVEYYANDPKTTPEAELISELYVPI